MADLEQLLIKYKVPDDKIDPKHLRFVVKALHDVGEHWYRIGEELNVDSLENIKQDYGSTSQYLIAMVDSLLRGRLTKKPGSPTTWRTIVRAVHSSGHSTHAKRLAGKLNEFLTFLPGSIAQAVDASSLFDEFPSDADIKEVVSMLLQVLVPVAARWFEVGALLGLPFDKLITIKNDPTVSNDVDRLRRVVEEWLMFAEVLELETPSWQVVVDVVAHGAGGNEPGLARELAEKSKSIKRPKSLPGGDDVSQGTSASSRPAETSEEQFGDGSSLSSNHEKKKSSSDDTCSASHRMPFSTHGTSHGASDSGTMPFSARGGGTSHGASVSTSQFSLANCNIIDQAPSSKEFIVIKWKGDEGTLQKYRLREAVSHQWRNLGQIFGFHESFLRNTAKKQRDDPDDCWDAIVMRWLQDGSKPVEAYPTTWRGLISALDDVGGFKLEITKLRTALEKKI